MRSQRLISFGLVLGIALFVIALLFKILHWQFAVPLLISGLSLIILCYLLRYLQKKPKTLVDHSKLAVAVILPIGFLFRVYHWSYGNLAEIISGLSILVLFVLLIRQNMLAKQPDGSQRTLTLIATLGILGGSVFRILHWPYGTFLLLAGFVALSVLIVLTVLKGAKSKDH